MKISRRKSAVPVKYEFTKCFIAQLIYLFLHLKKVVYAIKMYPKMNFSDVKWLIAHNYYFKFVLYDADAFLIVKDRRKKPTKDFVDQNVYSQIPVLGRIPVLGQDRTFWNSLPQDRTEFFKSCADPLVNEPKKQQLIPIW